ncbi:MAG: dolichol kinase [Prochlorococcus marinus CUG1435]|nr:dolichol kinase [Prochlorococcus marinus CUG1435]
MLKYIIILFYLFSIFLISTIFKKDNKDSREVVRKIIHIGIGPVIPIAQILKINQNSALIFTGLITLMVFINYKYKIFPSIEDIERKSYGTLFYCISLFFLIFLFWEKDPYSLITGFFIMTFGDGLAGLIGKSFDSKNWIFLKQKKSLLGTFTMFLASLVVIFSLGYIQQNSFNLNYFTIAFLATILEQFSVLGIDNLIVPITSALCFNFFITN